ncbi:lantibiotic dehydratase [Streptomyces virginiae]|uniref:lantibiotic dehydratase n=1 Tax=Streptomyces virginiae TaxID=1961 RepID=UPI002DD9C093|nr:lantibiotic dehydratase [Streptomyces virginiae]WSC75507.1 lantibiotic dehydratase [Streptomyces virginiae]
MTAHGRERRAEPLYRPLDWVMVRAPLLPSEALADAGKAAHDASTLTPTAPLVHLAVEVGSPDLAAALTRTAPDDPAARRVRGKLARYLIRMCTRPTPYGMFAGVGLAHWADHTDLSLDASPPRTRTRPDMAWLLGLVHRLEEDPDIRAGLRLATHPSVCLRGGRALLPDGRSGSTEAVSVRLTSAVRQVLETARRPTPPDVLAASLARLPGATPERSGALIERLQSLGFLQFDLQPPLTGGDPTRHVVSRLAAVPGASDVASRLDELSRELTTWDGLPVIERINTRQDLVARARALHPAAAGSSVLQTDLALTLDGRGLHRDVADEAAHAAELLLRLSPFPAGSPRLESYRRSFLGKYGTERRVPLLELIDPEIGLGLPSASGPNRSPTPHDQRRSRLLLDLALAANREHRHTVELTEQQVEELTVAPLEPATCPPSLDIALFVAADSAAAVDAGDFRLVVGPNLGAPAAGRHLGRFADLLGPPARAALDEIARLEQVARPDTLLAELVYVPGRERTANVAVRPSVRTHEIVANGVPGVPARQVAPLDELVVGLRSGRLSVEWPARDVRVVGVQGHMLNPMNAPPPVRFLLDAAMDGQCQFTPFTWGSANALAFLPRVQHGRIVLALAQWRLDGDLLPTHVSGEAFATALAAWRERWAVPRRVYLSSGDNRLLLDLLDPDQTEILRQELKNLQKGQSGQLQEALPGPEDAWLPDGGCGHVCEIVVPLVRGTATNPETGNIGVNEPPTTVGTGLREGVAPTARRPTPTAAAIATTAAHTVTRLKPPGSDWLYLKLYSSPWQQDEIIAGPLRTFGEFVTAAGLADTWFFIRYVDPEHHLRIRFHGDRSALIGALMDQTCSWADELLAARLITSFAFDTYEREIERYGGGEGMWVSEEIFGADSSSVARLIHASEGHELAVDRTDMAVFSVDDLLESLGLTPDERLAFYRSTCQVSRHGGQQYRQRGHQLRESLGRPDRPEASALHVILKERRVALAPSAGLLAALGREGGLERSHIELCTSYVHMHLNRILPLDGTGERQVLELLRRTREGLTRAPVVGPAEGRRRRAG